MKKIYLLGLALTMFSAAQAQTVIINDDFESYPIGGLNTGHWKNWYLSDADEALDITVNNRRASSGTKSGYIGVYNDQKGQDAILVMPTVYTKGKVTMEWKMYIPADSVGYFNLQETDSIGESYGYECRINTYLASDTITGGVSLEHKFVWTYNTDGQGYYMAYAPMTENKWTSVKQIVDLDAKKVNFYVDDVEATYIEGTGGNDYPGAMNSVFAIDFFSLADTSSAVSNDHYSSYYVDDVKITTENVNGINTVVKNSNLLSLYPNPSNDFISLSIADEKITNIEVFNVAGQMVLSEKPNAAQAKLNIQKLAAGVYTAKVSTKTGIYSREFVVKK